MLELVSAQISLSLARVPSDEGVKGGFTLHAIGVLLGILYRNHDRWRIVRDHVEV